MTGNPSAESYNMSMESQTVNVRKLVHEAQILECGPWFFPAEPFDIRVVERCLESNDLKSDAYSGAHFHWSNLDHYQRVAYLVHHIQYEPVDVEVYPESCYINDGNHRTLAAYVAGRETIQAQLSGYTDYFHRILELSD